MLVGDLHELAGAVDEVGALGDHAGDVAVLHHAAEAVGAEQVGVADLELLAAHLGLDLGAGADRAGDHVGVVAERGAGDGVVAGVLLDERVVAGEALEHAVPVTVAARVAHVDDSEAVAVADDRHEGAPHPPALAVAGALLDDPGVGEPGRLREGHHPVFSGVLLHVLDDRRDGHRARDLAREVTAHPVRHDEEPEGLLHRVRVLVVVTFLSDVRQPCGGELHPVVLDEFPRLSRSAEPYAGRERRVKATLARRNHRVRTQ